ncbi:hypothetical protein EYC80_003972 [Monilinia laxa]|uniref:N-acetyltransferase domain-containing protein n=1 Tax=Monilinia laxa TaxID=61186 RepID=A0A5N6KLC3_MONLA|nr:hypothetical protein EYC80_003972 [Monilinia laxa]
MLINEHTAISTNKVLLVPYEESHVIPYHEWMKDEEIQKATASEPLTLEEEYAMQRSWRTDHDKLTFIICIPDSDGEKLASEEVKRGVADAPAKMIGDINLFLSEADEDGEGCIGEIEIMIAEAGARGKGMGRSAVLAFMEYLRRHLEGILAEYRKGLEGEREGMMKLLQLRVKIGGKNLPSIALFESVGNVKANLQNESLSCKATIVGHGPGETSSVLILPNHADDSPQHISLQIQTSSFHNYKKITTELILQKCLVTITITVTSKNLPFTGSAIFKPLTLFYPPY